MKFIIENNELKYGDVLQHKYLAKNISQVVGGGTIDFIETMVILSDKSQRFGAVTKEQILSCTNLEDKEYYFDYHPGLTLENRIK